MNHKTVARYWWVVLAGCALGIAGCGLSVPAMPAASASIESGSTEDRVCKIVAEQFALDRSRVNAATSLADLGADELDFVELVIELEDHFDISIPDTAAERLLGTDDWQQGMKNVTLAKLAGIVDEQR